MSDSPYGSGMTHVVSESSPLFEGLERLPGAAAQLVQEAAVIEEVPS